MKYNAERYLALKRFEREQVRDKIGKFCWFVSLGGLMAMMVIQALKGEGMMAIQLTQGVL